MVIRLCASISWWWQESLVFSRAALLHICQHSYTTLLVLNGCSFMLIIIYFCLDRKFFSPCTTVTAKESATPHEKKLLLSGNGKNINTPPVIYISAGKYNEGGNFCSSLVILCATVRRRGKNVPFFSNQFCGKFFPRIGRPFLRMLHIQLLNKSIWRTFSVPQEPETILRITWSLF